MNFFQSKIMAKRLKFYIVATNEVNEWRLPRTNWMKKHLGKGGRKFSQNRIAPKIDCMKFISERKL